MTVITVLATIVCVAALMPALAEVQRVRSERDNPLRKLRVATRRNQVPSASGSFVGSR
jgi:hypothetical protein